MFNNNSFYPCYNNLLTGYRVTPVARFEETNSIFPDLQGNPLFFFDQSRNEIYVKQRKVQTGEVETLKYTLSKESVSTVSTPNYGEMIQELREEIKRIGEAVSVKVRKVDKDVQEN